MFGRLFNKSTNTKDLNLPKVADLSMEMASAMSLHRTL